MPYLKKPLAALVFIFVVALVTTVLIGPFSNYIVENGTVTSIVSGQPTATVNSPELAKAAEEDFGKLPLHFEQNVGQTEESVRYFARGKGYGIFLQDNAATFVLSEHSREKKNSRSAVLKMNIVGASETTSHGESALASKTNYFIGNDETKWRTDVANYEKVRFDGVYDGIDLVYYGNQRRLEYDFVVAPNADAKQIKLNFEGAKSVKIDAATGDLMLETALGTVRQHKPYAYQEIDGERREVAALYKKSAANDVVFEVAEYDRSRELVIDPILAYSSYLGGNRSDYGNDITVDAAGNAYVTGYTISTNFPVTAGALKTSLLPITSSVYGWDAFVSKIDPTGTQLVYSTYLGTNQGSDVAYGIAVDTNGNAYISGSTDHASFPIVNAHQPTFAGNGDMFLAKLNSTGSALLFSTFYGGGFSDTGQRIRLVNDNLYVTGSTTSSNFPTTAGVLKPAPCSGVSCATMASDAFIAKFNTNGIPQWSTLMGGNNAEFAFDIAVGSDNSSYIAGYTLSTDLPVTPGAFQTVYGGGTDGFVAKIAPDATSLSYATYLGGGLQSDRIWGIDADASGNAYVAGQTENSNFPVTAGAFDTVWNNSTDAFLTKLNPTGTGLIYSTYFGGGSVDKAFAVKVAANGEAFIGGETSSANLNFPLRNSVQGNLGTMYLARFNAAGSDIVFSTLLGTGGVKSIALDSATNAFVTGETHFLPTTLNAVQTTRGDPTSSTVPDGFVMKIGAVDESQAVYSISGTVNDGTFSSDQGSVIVTLSGTVNRSVYLAYSGNGIGQYNFGALPAGGNYTVSARKVGYQITTENAVFNNLQANQFADFVVQPNQQPVGVITSPTHQQTFGAPATINIQATASDPDGHAIQKVDFIAYHSTLGNIPLGTDTTTPYEFTWANVPVGTYALYAIPTDELGRRGYSTPTVHVFVIDTGTPSIQITSPLDGQTFTEGDTVPLGVQVSSSIGLVEWYDQNNTLIGRRTQAPWTTTWRVLNNGNYTITAKGFTSQNTQVTSQPVSIVVNAINH